MKKHLVFTGQVEIDFDKERAHIKKLFTGETADRQLHLVDLFEKGKLDSWAAAYNALPYNDEDECSEKEYVGLVFQDTMELLHYGKFGLMSYEVR